jgi:hypothetical protein
VLVERAAGTPESRFLLHFLRDCVASAARVRGSEIRDQMVSGEFTMADEFAPVLCACNKAAAG